MNELNLSYIISYDGITGKKSHGKLLPDCLHLKHLHIQAGRSSQATLLGNNHKTIESLYLSPSLVYRLENDKPPIKQRRTLEQQELALV
jgi:DNA adenine methylase